METFTTKELKDSLFGELCPTCGQRKVAKRSLCGRCFFKLSDGARKALYARLGQGYEQAMAGAMRELKCSSVLLPGGGDLFRPETAQERTKRGTDSRRR